MNIHKKYTTIPKNKDDLIARSHELDGKTVHEVASIENANDKGSVGQITESYFGLKRNNIQGPDFQELGVELKTTPIKKLKNGVYSAKERLVLSMINFNENFAPSFKESNLYKKIKDTLIVNYEIENFERVYRMSYFLEPSSDQMRVIENDYKTIIDKIKNGRAHELSDSDTVYLSASRKGHKEAPIKYSHSTTPAKKRAWSFKTKLMTEIVREKYNGIIPKVVAEYSQDYIINELIDMCNSCIGKTAREILGKDSKAKHRHSLAINKIIKDKKELLVDNDINFKTVVIDGLGPQEHISLKNIHPDEEKYEAWEQTELFAFLTNPLILFMFEKHGDDWVFADIKRIDFTDEEISRASIAFEKQKSAWLSDNYIMLKAVYDMVIHIRPKGKNKRDVITLMNGETIPKICWWINKENIRNKL